MYGPDAAARFRITSSYSLQRTEREAALDHDTDRMQWLLLTHATVDGDATALSSELLEEVFVAQRDVGALVNFVEPDEKAADRMQQRVKKLTFSMRDDDDGAANSDGEGAGDDAGDNAERLAKLRQKEREAAAAAQAAAALRRGTAAEDEAVEPPRRQHRAEAAVKPSSPLPTATPPSQSPPPAAAVVSTPPPAEMQPPASTPPPVPRGLDGAVQRLVSHYRGTTVAHSEVLKRCFESLPEFDRVKSHSDEDYRRDWFRVCNTALTTQLRALGCTIVGKAVTFPASAAASP